MNKLLVLITIIVVIALIGGVYNALSPSKTSDTQTSEQGNGPATKSVDFSSTIKSGNKLDVSGQNLKKIPESVFAKTNLEELNVSNNLLTGAIQAEIRHLQNLKILNASNNQMTGVPAEIGQLGDLEVLNLSNNQLTGLPYELGNLKKLRVLDISGNKYSEQDLEVIRKSLPSSVNIVK